MGTKSREATPRSAHESVDAGPGNLTGMSRGFVGTEKILWKFTFGEKNR